jgi:hypothetical protein
MGTFQWTTRKIPNTSSATRLGATSALPVSHWAIAHEFDGRCRNSSYLRGAYRCPNLLGSSLSRLAVFERLGALHFLHVELTTDVIKPSPLFLLQGCQGILFCDSVRKCNVGSIGILLH